MTKIRPSKFVGFETDHAESWDFYPGTEETENTAATKPLIILNFISGEARRRYGEAATEAFAVLCDQSIALFKEPS